jgi:hypothetical protein
VTAQHTVARNLANALAASTAICDWCVAQFALGCHVQLDAYGAAGLPGEAEAPFLFVYADGELEVGPAVAEATFELVLVAGVKSETEGGQDITVVSARSASANGLTVVGIADQAEALLNLALAAAAAGSFGAPYRAAVVSASGTLDYPLQWARARLSFFEPQTF